MKLSHHTDDFDCLADAYQKSNTASAKSLCTQARKAEKATAATQSQNEDGSIKTQIKALVRSAFFFE